MTIDTCSTDTAALIDAYAQLATSSIGHLTHAGYLPDIQPMVPCDNTVAGRVLTVTLTSTNTHVIRQALMDAAPRDVLCIDARVLEHTACWGALRSCAAIYEQLSAVIVLGQVTDSVQMRQLGLPVFAKGISAITTSNTKGNDAPAGMLGAAIDYQPAPDMDSVRIQTGDIAVMDADGVFVLAPDAAAQLLSECQDKHQQDDAKLQLFMEAYKNNTLTQLLAKLPPEMT
ncbi:RraA family protein [Psychrobacter aestuarii]|uniref:Putative 4-hydroxy-4-methyl-2-oxoglutarate aldolase n=1 Tax=Psychrobacter aestuarii TaxID=556327 RepID=A0ABN0VQK3_9GAMM|nr:RraA family protein [Psychrobacter aestuarii]